MLARRSLLVRFSRVMTVCALFATTVSAQPLGPEQHVPFGHESVRSAAALRLLTPSAQNATDALGNFYVADTAHYQIRKISPDGRTTVVAGSGRMGLPLAGETNGDGDSAVDAELMAASSVAVDRAGSLYIADGYAVRKVTTGGIIETLVGRGRDARSEGIPADAVRAQGVWSVAVDQKGNVYYAEGLTHRVRRVSADGVVTTVAGTADNAAGFAGDGGLATQARLSSPRGLALDEAGNLYIVDSGNQRVRRVSSDGTIHTVAGLPGGHLVATPEPLVPTRSAATGVLARQLTGR